MGVIDERLKALGVHLPTPPKSVANYLPFIVTGNLIIVSGQLPMVRGELAFEGKVGADIDIETAREAAYICGINIIAQVQAATGDLDKVTRVVRLGGFVNCVDTFEAHPTIINKASDLMAEVFGDAGAHARSAVGVNSLPLGAPVELDAIFEIA